MLINRPSLSDPLPVMVFFSSKTLLMVGWSRGVISDASESVFRDDSSSCSSIFFGDSCFFIVYN